MRESGLGEGSAPEGAGRLLPQGKKERHLSGWTLMPSYDFEVWQGDRALHKVKGVELERAAHAWDRVGNLARRFNQPGTRIAVKDESGGLAILVGARTAQMLSAQAT